MNLPGDLMDLVRGPALCFLATVDPDGSPQLTQTWVDTVDGEHLLINTVQGFRKLRNIERDPRVAVTVADPDRPGRYFGMKGRVLSTTTEGGAETIEALSRKYIGGPYSWPGGRDQVRVNLTISVDKIVHEPRW